MRRGSILSIAAVTALAGMPAVVAETQADLEIVVHEDGTLRVTSIQTWDGEEARKFRQSLDAILGDGDGILTPEEVDTIADATEADMMSKSFPRLVSAGAVPLISQVNVTFEDANGATDISRPLVLLHDLVLDGTPLEGDDVEFTVAPIYRGRATLTLPDGWSLAEGGPSLVTSGDANATRAEFALEPGSNVTLRLVRGTLDTPEREPEPEPVASEEDEPATLEADDPPRTSDPTPPPRAEAETVLPPQEERTLSLPALVALGAVLLAAFSARRRRE